MKREKILIITGLGLIVLLLAGVFYFVFIYQVSPWVLQDADKKGQSLINFSEQIKQKSDLPFCDTLSEEDQIFTQCQLH